MIQLIKQFVWNILNFIKIGPLIQLCMVGELHENGWMRTFISKKSEDKNGDPIPWYTYPAIDFLKERLKSSHNVFEYGCGGSTTWLASRVAIVHAVEDHLGWKEIVEKTKPQNATIHYQAIDNEYSYSKVIQKMGQKFDLIIVDGKERNECVEFCLEAISDTGIVMLDNSERADYHASFEFLKEKGFKKMDFWGMTPIIAEKSCTTFFYRANNIFDI